MASPFVVHDPEFLRALGDAPRLDRVVDIDAHEGPVYIADADALYFTSLPTPDWQVAIRRIALDGDRFPLAADRVETLVKHTRADDFVKPNGLAFSPDESLLYVTDSGANQEAGSFYPHLPHHVIAYDVDHGRHLVNRRLFAVTNPGFPDGLKVDADGRVYASSFSGVQVFSPLGDLIGEILLAGAVNFCFGGRAGNVLFVTTDTAVWAATLAATGAASLAAEQIGSGSETKELPHDRQPHAPDHR